MPIFRLVVVLGGLLAAGVFITGAAADEGFDAYQRGDFAQAREIWRKAGYSNAQAAFDLAILIESGQGGPADHKLAFKWYKRAADQGMAEARPEMARLFIQTRDIDLFSPASSSALRWAQSKDPEAIIAVGMIHEIQGVESRKRGIMRWFNPLIFAWGYYQVAAQYGHADAVDAARRMENLLGPKHLQKLEGMVDIARDNIDGTYKKAQ